uniref:NADH-ubiquinone oxidoreductase chain 4L n=1 Tax=Amphiura sinicola TaxID=2705302 RepID=A0A6C0FGX8_9ECHI|nr:NADH dehydrogenase subunit 4L [Amphiura sinicola]QHT54209.1 NADH dehydrogenase subunit 4L [Amphiura sinicola]
MILITNFIFLSTIIGLTSMINNKKFFLSLLISLELIFLNLIVLNFLSSLSSGNNNFFCFSLFLLTLAAVDASLGISIITLINRNFNESSLTSISSLKN